MFLYVSGSLAKFVVGRSHLHVPVSDLVGSVADDEAGNRQFDFVRCNSDLGHRGIVITVLQVVQIDQFVLKFELKSNFILVTVKTMDNVRGHFAAFVAFKTKNQCHIIILLFETLQF